MIKSSMIDHPVHKTFPDDAFIVLPKPFDLLICVRDKKRKCKRVLVCLAPDLSLHVYLAPPGIAIVSSPAYASCSHMIFMQCTNASIISVGFVVIGRETNLKGSR